MTTTPTRRNELKRGRLDLERITRCLSMAADMLPVPPISTEEIRSQGDARRVIASMETRVSMMPEAQVLGILGAVRRTASS